MMPILTAQDVSKSYKHQGQVATQVLHGASLVCMPSEFVAIMGPSGAGKSTLLHILASLDQPDSGSVSYCIDDQSINIHALDTEGLAHVRNTMIGMVFQFHHLLPEFNALENVMMPALIAGTSVDSARAQAMLLLDRVGVAHRSSHSPSELSGGEQQRIAIARALMNKPRILFADEPTGNLDAANAAAIVDLLCDVQREDGVACIVATHSHDLAARSHRVVQMRDGRCEGGFTE